MLLSTVENAASPRVAPSRYFDHGSGGWIKGIPFIGSFVTTKWREHKDAVVFSAGERKGEIK